MYFIAVVDDNQNDLNRINQVIQDFCIENNIQMDLQLFDSPLKMEKPEIFDIIFLDIDMPDINGIDYAKTLDKPVYLVFITHMDHLVFDSFTVHPYDFIRKAQLDKQIPFTLKDIFHELNKQNAFIVVKTNRGQAKIKVADIIYCETIDHITTIYTYDQESYSIRQSLKETIKQIQSDHFIRINKSHYINMNYIQSFNHKTITLKNEIIIPIGKNKYDLFIKKYLCDFSS